MDASNILKEVREESKSRDMLLMMKDRIVMRINFDQSLFQVIDKAILPYSIQGKLRESLPEKDSYSKYEMTQQRIIDRANENAIVSFLASRVLPLSRENAKKLYNALRLEQKQDELSKVKVALACRAISLQDNYWVKMDGDLVTWKNVNLRENSLSEAVAQIALHGSSLTIQGMPRTPELTGQGAYAKAWIRDPDERLMLYKLGAHGSAESRIEVMVSNLLDNCNVDHLKYEAGETEGVYACKCECMTTDEVSMLHGSDFDSWCNVHGLDSRAEALRILPEMVYKMGIVDYLISNRDRHSLNWFFFYNSDTMEILPHYKLYDHNNAFDIPLMENPDAEYLYDARYTMRQFAKMAMSKVDFHFYREFTRDDFITERQYNSFMSRAKELGIQKCGNKY